MKDRLLVSLCLLTTVFCLLPNAWGSEKGKAVTEFSGVTPLQWSIRMADSEMTRRGDSLVWKPQGRARWDYTVGLFTLSLLKLNKQAADARYVQFAKDVIGSFITPEGQIRDYTIDEYNIDQINPGKTVIALYRLTKEERYKKAADLLRRQLETHPRTSEGGFWHKKRYPHQMWLDGIFMGSPFYAEYLQLTKAPVTAFDDVTKQIRLIDKYTYNPKSGLNHHGWDESKQQDWADKTTGVSPNFWGRAMGWYGMALVDVLDFYPKNHPARKEIIALIKKLCDGVIKYQDTNTGLWYQVLDQGTREGNYLEATASCMFVYTMTKAVNMGYLPRKDYEPAILKGYRGIIEHLIRKEEKGSISLTKCCSVAGLGYGRDGSFAYYIKEPVIDNDLKGVGPFILAGIELQRFAAAGK
jgi:unsaturated rhamnogalacturonyl hydrolase